MKVMARMAALAAALAFVSGCSHSMRHTNQQLKDQVKLPAAPAIEPSTSAPAGPGIQPPRRHPVRGVRSRAGRSDREDRRGSSSSSRESPCADNLSRDVLRSSSREGPLMPRTLSLLRQGHPLSDPRRQLEVLETGGQGAPFARTLSGHGLGPLRSEGISVLQVNVGKLCNQTCRHCHVDAGPDRREIMSRETTRGMSWPSCRNRYSGRGHHRRGARAATRTSAGSSAEARRPGPARHRSLQSDDPADARSRRPPRVSRRARRRGRRLAPLLSRREHRRPARRGRFRRARSRPCAG